MNVSAEQIEYKGWLLAAVMLLFSLSFRSFEISLGVGLGALIAIINYRWLKRFVHVLVAAAGGGTQRNPFFFMHYSLKYLFTGLVIFLSFKYEQANPVAMAIGVSVIFLAICWEAISVNLKLREGTNHA